MSIKKLSTLLTALTLGIFAITGSVFAAESTLFGDATIVSGGNPGQAAQLVTDGDDNHSGVNFDVPTGTTFADLEELSSDYNFTEGSCGVGSPRFSVAVDDPNSTDTGNIFVYFGSSPNYNDCPANTWTDTGDLLAAGKNVDTTQLDEGTFYHSYADAVAAFGDYTITDILLVADAPNQTLLVDNVTVDTTTEDFESTSSGDQPVGAITNPDSGEEVSGVVNFTATYDDGDDVNDDAVQWAIRQGDCTTGTTVFGNVNGRNDAFTWDGSAFSTSQNVDSLTDGQYCFVFNPTDDAGQTDVRVTRTFMVDSSVGGTPTDKDDCKNGGWRDFSNPSFRNQGQCVSFVNAQSRSTVNVRQSNTSTVSNSIRVNQNTGGNRANGNTGSGDTTVTTGDADADVNVTTNTNRNRAVIR